MLDNYDNYPIEISQRIIKARGFSIFCGCESFSEQFSHLADALADDEITIDEFDRRLETLRDLDRLRKINKNRQALQNLEQLQLAASMNLHRLEQETAV